MTIQFFNHQLDPISNYNEIVWEWLFSDHAKESQLIYFLQKVDLPKKICLIVTHQFNVEQINSSDIDLIIINASDHPTNYFDYNYFTKPYILLTSDFKRSDYHPFHLLFSAYFAQYDEIDFENKKQYKVSLINRSPRITRIYILNKLRQNTKLHNLYIQWFQMSQSNGPVPTYKDINEILGMETEAFLRYEKNFPQYSPMSESSLCIKIEDFRNSYLNLVVESRLEDIGYLTEKIYKPIRAGQLFLVQGPPGSIRYLRSIGFDTFDDFIDHSYDEIIDWQVRTDMLLNELDRIYDIIEEFYFLSIKRRKANREHLLSNKLINHALTSVRLPK